MCRAFNHGQKYVTDFLSYFVDIIGQIVEVTHIEIVSLNGKDTEKISLQLKNEE